MTFGFTGPAAGLGVTSQGFGVGTLSRQDRQVTGIGAEVGTVFTNIGVGAGALDLGADTEATGETGLDRRGIFPVAVDDRQ